MEVNKILQGDCLERLKELPDNSVDSIVTDPPYGLSFMGKKWDYDVPSKEVWVECLRVLKPGGHLLSFAGSRTYHRMAVNIEDAGFEIRDQIMWIYGSGFPKSMNIGKAIEGHLTIGSSNVKDIKKLNGEREVVSCGFNITGKSAGYRNKEYDMLKVHVDYTTKEGKQFNGWGTALKPAHEPIVVARKPLSEKNVAQNVLKWGTGGINIDGCRVEHNEKVKTTNRQERESETWREESGFKNENPNLASANPQGRFPANIILECTCDKTKEGDIIGNGHFNSKVNMKGHTLYEGGFKDFEQEDRVLKERSIIHTNPNCPCFIMDLQSGSAGAFAPVKQAQRPNNVYGNYEYFGDNGKTFRNDKGGASRFFYCAKASKSERNNGCEHMPLKHYLKENKMGGEGDTMLTGSGNPRDCRKHNNHPTVKPIKLMEYLVRLVTPSSGIVLDPFIGSGTTAISCIKQDFKFIGIEKETEYIEIANARLKHYQGDHNE